MSDDIQQETERIHQGIVESLSFSEALANRDAEIELLREQLSRFERCYVTVDDVLKAKNRDAEI
jgi:hypothetical protein